MIRLENISKSFADGETAVFPLSLEVREGEFLTLLGPSGCGKTTILRMIAGFEQPSEGTIYLDNQPVTSLPPYQRHVNLVFQQYALFPHMSVADNILFGLRMKKIPLAEQAQRLSEVAALTQLEDLLERFPDQLSGGQQQRVAIARAIVGKPKVLLLDEPLSALDLKLRQRLQHELKQLQRKLGITFVYVTHDQEEAMMMSDRIVVMNKGHVEQVGTPRQIYDAPQSLFAATFIGENNIFQQGQRTFAVRPEKIRLLSDPASGSRKKGTIQDIIYLGSITKAVIIDEEGTAVHVLLERQASPVMDDLHTKRIGQLVGLDWSEEDEVRLS